MSEKLKIGKRGAAKRIAEKIKAIRQSPISQSVFQVVEEFARSQATKPTKKVASKR